MIKKIHFGPNKVAGEVFFHKKENPQSEDDGYLMSFVYDWEKKSSEFVMWDAKTMADERRRRRRSPHPVHDARQRIDGIVPRLKFANVEHRREVGRFVAREVDCEGV